MPELIAVLCSRQLDLLSKRFAFKLPQPIVIFLFQDWQHYRRVFGRQSMACAIPPVNAVALSIDCPLDQILNHELSHLFAMRWNGFAPPVMLEGLAVWLDSQCRLHQMDYAALRGLGRPGFDVDSIFFGQDFYVLPDRDIRYTVAGSFVGFLIKRLGWQGFMAFYQECGRRPLNSLLQKYLGLTYRETLLVWQAQIAEDWVAPYRWSPAA